MWRREVRRIPACATCSFSAVPFLRGTTNSAKLLAAAEKYGCRLHINGHEHNGRYTVGRAGSPFDVNCGTPTTTFSDKVAFAVVEIDETKAVFHVYTRAAAVEEDGVVRITERPRKLFARTVTLAS